jgi:hypothetical protein
LLQRLQPPFRLTTPSSAGVEHASDPCTMHHVACA